MRVIVDEDARPHSETAGSDVMAARRALFANDDAPRLLEHVGPTVGFPDGGTRAAIIVPLRWAGEVQGTLLVAGRRDGLVAFGTDDLRLLETLGSRLGLVAENSGLVERLAASLADASQLAAIVQSSEDAIFAVNADGRITTWNPAAATMFGYRVDEVIGRVAADVLTQGEGDRLRESVGVVFRGAVIRDIQMEWIRADGVLVPVSITMSPIRGPDEQVVSVSAIVRDESDRIKAEAARVASAELLRTVIAGSPVGMGVTGWDHHWIQANPALCALLGMSVEETIGRSALECIHPDDLETVHQLEERVFDGEPTVYSLERRYVDRSGRVVVAIVTARLIREPSSDEPVALYTIADITERRIAEDRTRSTEERFRRAARAISAVQDPTKVLQAVLESARETLRAEYAAVATYSDDGTTITQLQVNGLDSGEMLERLGTWPSATGVRGMAARLDRPIRLRDVTAHEQFAGFPDGHPRISTFLAVPIPHEGAGRAVLFLANKVDAEEFSEADETIAVALATHAAVCLDNARITARSLELVHDLDRANLELVRANEAKTRFLATVAHELRTPLHAILVAGELVHDPPAGPLSGEEIHDLGVTIESSGRHMVRLIDDLVDLSRIESGHLDLRPTHVTLGDVLAEIASTLARTAETRGVTIELPDGPGPSIFADPVRLRQILLNLIANALKFTARGGRVWVAVDTTRESTHITVHDTGIGIAPEDMERAFLPFEQVSRTSTPGAGLGLAISRSLAELHGGELSATSQPGLGSAFTLTLPRRLQPGGRKLPTEPIPLPAPEGGGGLPILVVEDDPTALGLATDLLRMADYQVWQARGLGEAIKVLADATPALILLDIRLGDGSGLDLVERLRTDGKHRDLPILVLSADAMPDDARRARAAGCNDFLAKPVSPRVLLSRIHDLVSEAPEAAEA